MATSEDKKSTVQDESSKPGEQVQGKKVAETDVRSTENTDRVDKTDESSIPKNDVATNERQTRESQTDSEDTETTEQLKNQLGVLMSQLATLSAEKSKMEANFQMDKKQLRSERDECEKVIKDLKDRLKKAQNVNHSEIEHVKCKLIMERHEREKEHGDFVKKIKELQKLLYDEQRSKEQLEGQLKTHLANKTQCKILEAELEITKTKLKQAEEAAKETPPLLLSLQAEMAVMKKQHLNAIREEQKRAAAAEQQARGSVIVHEARVAGLEARLAELSEIVGGYDRLRQQDQLAIQKLKDQLVALQDTEHGEVVTSGDHPEEIISKIKSLYTRLLNLDNKKKDSAHIKSLLNSLDLRDEHSDYKEKYDVLLQEFEDYRRQAMCKYNMSSNVLRSTQQQKHSLSLMHDKDHDKTQLNLLKVHNSNLEERIRMINSEMINKERVLQEQLEQQQKLFQEEHSKLEHTLHQKDNEYRNRISVLEQQLLRQRERSMALVEEKDKEIVTLKASFRALLPNKETVGAAENKKRYESTIEPVSDLVTGLLSNDSPPILHYTQELARKEVQVSSSRKKILELEATLREQQREMLHTKEQQQEEIKRLKAYIIRLEACKSREGANLEYLKNVFINYLTTNDASSKRHMLNAISTVLRFTPDELSKVKH
ncbi:PREDICTED: GRIP and coiled-coil domain-containing protein 1-like isoform X1 [Vollenhovia emeryi]|uniref:GRIP and coiled-coil domain-containing protein 1-like isoform X1 n=1 Tax=Vollenhovia emeryi TaxID=411798 RepID=UPI0005F52555|nr:PREDICTED: GRIP and coiled-coil domain-containing protein 1-like isoform X1 [Vollenhovia emeryi]XP_011863685.1 PREDICTED: GRIP and coiled-coil domain-containing protein 1-like isoform X1 [Vollenhovia emeryi]XP_011863686.1 PREDICTED: GRIP and coiled-coil domain-containing protein 1-like isoform X1 [Vollenhovia emeryi]